MGGELTGAVFRFGEKAIERLVGTTERGLASTDVKLGGKIGQQYVKEASTTFNTLGDNAKQALGKMFGLESQIPNSPGGHALRRGLDMEARATDRNLAVLVADHKAQGKTVSRGELAHIARTGKTPQGATYRLQNGQTITGSRDSVWGPKDQNVVAALYYIEQRHGAEKAKNLADALGVHFHEQLGPMGNGLHGTRLVGNLQKSPLFADADFKFRPSPYKEASQLERKISRVASASLAYKAGLAHMTTPLNLLIGHSLGSFTHALKYAFGDSYEGAKAQLQMMGVMGEMFATEMDQAYKFKHGLINKFAPGSVGEFVHGNFMIPGFTTVRHRSLVMAAKQGEYIAQEQAANLLSQNPKVVQRAMKELEWLGLSGKKIQSRGGSLLPEEIRTAMFENANQRIFIDSGRNRAQLATSSFAGRMLGMFHNYGVQQAGMLRREFGRAIERKDPIQLIRDIAILGTVFPAAGAAVNSLEKLWTGKNPEDIKADLEETIDPRNFWSKVDAFSHTAGFGVATSYARAASRHKLAQALVGPVASAGIELGQDVVGLEEHIRKGTKSKDVAPWEPIARDILHDIPSLGIGAFISEHAFPTQAAINKQKPMTAARMRARRAAARRKALGK